MFFVTTIQITNTLYKKYILKKLFEYSKSPVKSLKKITDNLKKSFQCNHTIPIVKCTFKPIDMQITNISMFISFLECF